MTREIPLYNPIGPDPCIMTADGATHTDHGRSLLCEDAADLQRHAVRILSRALDHVVPAGTAGLFAVAPWSANPDTACIDVVLYAPPSPENGGTHRYIIASEGGPNSCRAVNAGDGVCHGWSAHYYTAAEVAQYLEQYGPDLAAHIIPST